MRRAMSRLALPFQPCTPGAVSDSTPVWISSESMKASALSELQAGLRQPDGSPPCAGSASAQNGGTTCW